MKVAIEGCAHGELENIYDTIELLEEKEKIKVDLLICCGDFQSSRNDDDLSSMAVPQKYRHICTFYKYYSGEKTAPILTIFIGGNHEASNYLQELPYGGWVAPNIYYVGYAGVINIAGLRIAGLSGIYKGKDYLKGHYEKVPYDENSKRTVYHIRNLETFRLKQLSGKLDVFLSHDWPTNVTKYGNIKQLLKKKPFFKEDIESNQLGSKPCEQLMEFLKPFYWFSAHLHCKFAALIPHENEEKTKFLALDKCLPKRKFLQVIDIPHKDEDISISYDLEWLAILHLTNHLLNVKNSTTYMPGPGGTERYNFTPTKEEKLQILERFDNNLKIPKNFARTAPAYEKGTPKSKSQKLTAIQNPQTVQFCETLAVDDPLQLISENTGVPLSLSMEESFSNTTFLDDTFEEDRNLSQPSPMKKLGNLSLPEPKMEPNLTEDSAESETNEDEDKNPNSQDEDQNDDVESVEDEDKKDSQNECDENESNIATEIESESGSQSVESDNNEEAVKTSEVNVEEPPCESPMPKKLKRRNENLYKS